MKLYAKLTSERASEGQGGNEKLEAEFFIGGKKRNFLVFSVKLDITADGKNFNMWGINHKEDSKIVFFENYPITGKKLKRKQQKGELCQDCGDIMRQHTTIIDYLYCWECWGQREPDKTEIQ